MSLFNTLEAELESGKDSCMLISRTEGKFIIYDVSNEDLQMAREQPYLFIDALGVSNRYRWSIDLSLTRGVQCVTKSQESICDSVVTNVFHHSPPQPKFVHDPYTGQINVSFEWEFGKCRKIGNCTNGQNIDEGIPSCFCNRRKRFPTHLVGYVPKNPGELRDRHNPSYDKVAYDISKWFSKAPGTAKDIFNTIKKEVEALLNWECIPQILQATMPGMQIYEPQSVIPAGKKCCRDLDYPPPQDKTVEPPEEPDYTGKWKCIMPTEEECQKEAGRVQLGVVVTPLRGFCIPCASTWRPTWPHIVGECIYDSREKCSDECECPEEMKPPTFPEEERPPWETPVGDPGPEPGDPWWWPGRWWRPL